MASVPQRAPLGGLDTEICKELKDDEELAKDGSPSKLGEEVAASQDLQSKEGEEEDRKEEVEGSKDGEAIIDPDDPLYGLDQRLKHLKLDAETKAVIKQKLIEAQGKIAQNLELRQQNLESKLTAVKKK